MKTTTDNLKTYAQYAPTGFDSAGAFLDDRQEWYVVPVIQTRDSGPMELSNFAAALSILGGEDSEGGIEVHRFGHWGPGWFEIILARPDHADAVRDIAARLEDYPLLNEDDFSQREWSDYAESWEQWGARDFSRALAKEFDGYVHCEAILDDCPKEALNEFYESLIPSGEYYIGESSGVCLPIDRSVKDCTRAQFAQFIRAQRKALASA